MFLELNPADFDVNIHPQKREVKFAFENDIFNFIYRAISKKLLATQDQVEITLKSNTAPMPKPVNTEVSINNNVNIIKPVAQKFQAVEELSTLLKTAPAPKFMTREHEDPAIYNLDIPQEEQPETQQNIPSPVQKEKQPSWWHGPYKYLGQLQNSYLLFDGQDGLLLIDQHAAQERIYFEEFCDLISKGEVVRQPLMFPLNIELPASKLETVLNWESFLKGAGFEVSKFSATVLLVSATPALLKMGEEEIKEFILSFAETAGNPLKADNAFRHKFIATKACKKAVKAGEALTEKEAFALLENLKNCQDALHCPHGRPTMLNLTMAEISKKIGRG